MGTTVWSPLLQGILSGKYNKGIPKESRFGSKEWVSKDFMTEKYFGEKSIDKTL